MSSTRRRRYIKKKPGREWCKSSCQGKSPLIARVRRGKARKFSWWQRTDNAAT